MAINEMKIIPLEKEIFLIDSFLSEKECELYINQAEKIGFSEADVQVSGQERLLMKNVRNNERVNIESVSMANEWWYKLKEMELPKFEDKTPVGLSPHFRFYKYVPGQRFNMHKDGRQLVNGNTTYYTLLAYLNEGCGGGSTKFRQGDIEVPPKTGNALLFQHQLWHQGTRVESGKKYVLRTDVMFS